MYYLYKDSFLSGWGLAKRGSYVISNKPIKRKEFKLLGSSAKLSDFKYGSGKDRDFELWMFGSAVKDTEGGRAKHTTKKLYWIGKGKPLSTTRPTPKILKKKG